MRDEGRGPRAAVALKRARLGLRHPVRLGRGIDAHGRAARRLDATRGDIDLGSVITHEIGVGHHAIRVPYCYFYLPHARFLLLFAQYALKQQWPYYLEGFRKMLYAFHYFARLP